MSTRTLIDTSCNNIHTFRRNIIDSIRNGWDEHLTSDELLYHLQPIPLPDIINIINTLLSEDILSFDASLFLIKSYCSCTWYEDFTVLDIISKSDCTEVITSPIDPEPHLIVHTQDINFDERVTLIPSVIYYRNNTWQFKHL